MKKALSMLLVITLLFGVVASPAWPTMVTADATEAGEGADEALDTTLINPSNSEGRTLNFNQGWKFIAEYVEEAISPDYSLAKLQKWENVNLPHSARLEKYSSSGQNGIYMGDAMYVKHFPISEDNDGKKIFITFDGVMGVSNVWVNGVKMHTKLADLTGDDTYYGGFLPFVIDITDAVVCDGVTENVIVVYANSKYDPTVPPGKDPIALDFSYYGGIYRDVTMTITNGVHITDANYENIVAGGGILVDYPDVSKESATVFIKTHVRNESPVSASVAVESKIVDKEGNVVGENITSGFELAKGADNSFEQTLTITDPKLWDLDNPYLHTLISTVYVNGEEVDRVETVIGIRKIEMHKDYGLKINGVVQDILNGVNRHQEYAYIGYAASESLQRKDAMKFKEAGINIVRTAHYPASTAFLDACDELGILVIEPTPGWQWYSSDPLFSARVKNDIRQMVRRDRNRPCILAYETVLNETSTPAGFTLSLAEVAKEEHPSVKVATENSVGEGEKDTVSDIMYKNPERSDFAVGFTREYGDSYREQMSEDNFFFRRVFRGTGMDYGFYPGGEGAMFMQAVKRLVGNQNDTVYYCPVDAASGSIGGAGGSSRSYLMIVESFLKGQQDNEVAFIGGTSWIGIDHNRTYASDMSACGLWDLLRLPKFSYYAMASQRPAEKNDALTAMGIDNGPMVFISSYWTEKAPVIDKTNEAFTTLGTDSERIIVVYSNTEKVKLSVISENGSVLYEKVASPMSGKNREYINAPFEFLNVPYFEGSHLEAIGYDANGNAVANHEVYTAQSPDHLELVADTMGIVPVADGSDTVMVYAYIKDKNGTVCHDAYNKLTFSIVSGDATIVGDGISRVGSNPVNAEAGIFGVYVKMGTTAGDIKIRVEADGIQSDEIIISSVEFTEPASPYFLIAYTGNGEEAASGDYLITLPYAISGNVNGMVSKIKNEDVEINGVKYTNNALFMTGFDVYYNVSSGYNRFTGAITVLGNGNKDAAGIFKIFVDGRAVYVSDVVVPGEVVNIDVDIPNGNTLELVTVGLGHDVSNYPQYVWLSPYLHSGADYIDKSEFYKNIALGKPTEASSVVSGSSSRFAVDGNESSIWIGNLVGERSNASPEYLIVDLEKTTNICGVRVGLLNDSIAYKYQVQVSENKTSWKTVATVEKTGQASDIRDLFKETNVRYVKILFTEIGTDADRGQYSNATITELEVYEDREISTVREFKLKNLGIKGKEVLFDPYEEEYTVSLEGYETELRVVAEAYYKDSVITVNGAAYSSSEFTVSAIPADGIIRVKVTSPSGKASTEYKIKIVGSLGNIFYDNAMNTMAEDKNGESRWLYQRYNPTTGQYVDLPARWIYANNQPYMGREDASASWARMGAKFAHPGSGDVKTARTYVAPIDGQAELELFASKLVDMNGTIQNGAVGLSIYKGNEKIWPLDADHARLDGTNVIDIKVKVTLSKGDRIYFVVDNWDGANGMDATYMDTTVRYISAVGVSATYFKQCYSEILAKTTSNVQLSDKETVTEALATLSSSTASVKKELIEERRLLENLKIAIQALENGSKPLGAESFSMTHSIGGSFTLPSVANIYMSDGSTGSASIVWDSYDAKILNTVGTYCISGSISGYDLRTYLNLKVTSISQNSASANLPMAFASYSNITAGGAGGDFVHLVNDGDLGTANWTTYNSKNAEEWLGIIFGDGTTPQAKNVDRITLQMPWVGTGSTQLPNLVKVQYYTGPSFSELPADANNMLGTSHPLADNANWTDATIILQEAFASQRVSAIEIDTVNTVAIRVVLTPNKRPSGIAGCIGVIEMVCHEGKGVSSNVAKNPTSLNLPLAFASYSNISSGGNGGDFVHLVNDGILGTANWTTYNSKAAEEWLGMIFGSDTEISEETIDRITLRMPYISTYATQVPNLIKIQYYTGPDFTDLPADANNMRGTSHPLANDANWSDATIISQEPFASQKTSTILIEPVTSVAIRLVMSPNKRPSGAAGCIGIIEMECFNVPKIKCEPADISGILVDGQPIESFSKDKLSYEIQLKGSDIPEIEAVLGDNSAYTVLKPVINSGEVKLIVYAEDGVTKVVYTIKLIPSGSLDLEITRDILKSELAELLSGYDPSDYSTDAWTTIVTLVNNAVSLTEKAETEEELEAISLAEIKADIDNVKTLEKSNNLGLKVNLTLYSSISLNFYAPYGGVVLGINIDGVDVPCAETVAELADGDYYAFQYSGIAPSMGARSLKIKIRYLYEGEVMVKEINYSILKYSESVLKNESVDNKGKALTKSILAYVKAAYEYFGDNNTSDEQIQILENLVNEYPTDLPDQIPTVEGVDPSALRSVIRSAQFSLADGTIRLVLNVIDTNAQITVKMGDSTIAYLPANHGQSQLFVNLRAYQLIDVLTISSGDLVGTYSFFKYTEGAMGMDEKLDNLLLAMYSYSLSAYEYKNSQGGI